MQLYKTCIYSHPLQLEYITKRHQILMSVLIQGISYRQLTHSYLVLQTIIYPYQIMQCNTTKTNLKQLSTSDSKWKGLPTIVIYLRNPNRREIRLNYLKTSVNHPHQHLMKLRTETHSALTLSVAMDNHIRVKILFLGSHSRDCNTIHVNTCNVPRSKNKKN